MSEVAKRGDTFLALLKCSMIKKLLSREHFCAEANSPNRQCLLQVICKRFGAIFLFNNGKEGCKNWGEKILREAFQKHSPVVLLYAHSGVKLNPKELMQKEG